MITEKIQPDFIQIGLSLKKFLVENISLPPEVEQALDKRSEMGLIGNLGAYSQYQTANAIEKSSENGGAGGLGAVGMGLGAGAGMGLGVGAAMARQMGNAFQQTQFNPQSASSNPAAEMPPPLPAAIEYFVAVNGKSEGPYSLSQLSGMVTSQGINSSNMVWKKGMAAWSAASTVPELLSIFDSIPPPLP
jgi:membrane protease subunit (stomatin/prohibitin family)